MRRIDTPRGPLYVWAPPGATKAGVVVYVHGFRNTAESAIREHRLQEQFERAGKRVPFVVVEAPTGSGQQVVFPDLSEVLAAAGVPQASAVTAVAHSGGYSTVLRWLKHPSLRHVILLDAVYGGSGQFETWAKTPGKWGKHTLELVGYDTRLASKALAEATGSPYHAASSHMGIVTEGRFIPMLVGRAPLPGAGAGAAVAAVMVMLAWGLWRLAR